MKLVLGGVITLFVCLGVFALDEFDEDERDSKLQNSQHNIGSK